MEQTPEPPPLPEPPPVPVVAPSAPSPSSPGAPASTVSGVTPYVAAPKRENFFVSLCKTAARTATISATLLLMFGVFFVVFVLFLVGLVAGGGGSSPTGSLDSKYPLTYVAGDEGSDNVLLRMNLVGTVLGEKDETAGSGGVFSASAVTYGYEFKAALALAAKDPKIKGVIVNVSSPGGTIFGAHAISEGIADYRKKTGKPIVAFVEGLAASAAYWSSAATDKIWVDYGSEVGSIGVISGPYTYFDRPTAIDGGLLSGGIVTQNGIQQNYITAGKGKDFGNPFRPATPEELAIVQTGVDNEYRNFVGFVSERRAIPPETIVNQIGAHLYDNETALRLKLMDETLNLNAAYDKLAETAKVSPKDYRVMQATLPGQGSTGGLFSRALGAIGLGSHAAPDASGASGQTAGANGGLCRLATIPLAYHGDPARLCGR